MKKHSMTTFLIAFSLFLAATTLVPATAAPKGGIHCVVIHVDEIDPKRMNMALNNAPNVDAYYKAKAEEVKIEVVAYRPGLLMLHAAKSPVKKRIASFG